MRQPLRGLWPCLVIALAVTSCGGGGGSSTPSPPVPPPSSTYSVGGNVTGLSTGQTLHLRNGAEVLTVSANGPFGFPTKVPAGSTFDVSIDSEPQDRQCSIGHASGTVGQADVNSLSVDCQVAVNWVTDGNVFASVLSSDGRVLYIGGDFTHVGPRTGSFVPLDANSGAVVNEPGISGSVVARAPDGGGGWYVGGSFTAVGDTLIRNLAHVRADGTLDRTFNPSPDGEVSCLLVSGGRLIVGGGFGHIAGATRSYLAAIDLNTGTAASWAPAVGGPVRVLAASGQSLYMAGAFLSVGGQSRPYLAGLDIDTGAVLPWDPRPADGFGTPSISVLRSDGSSVYVGGRFSTIGGGQRTGVAAVDGATGLVTAWDARLGVAAAGATEVADLVTDAGTVYIAGRFDTAGGQPRAGLAAVTASDGTATGWDPAPVVDGVAPPSINAVAISPDAVYVAGTFTAIGGRAARNIASLDKVSGSARTWYEGSDQFIQGLSIAGNSVWVSGRFATLGGEPRNHLAAIDTKTGRPTSWNADLALSTGLAGAGAVTTITLADSNLYVAGNFDRVAGQPRSGLAALDAATAALLPWAPTTTGTVRAIAARGGVVYVGGLNLNSVNGQPTKNLAAISSATGDLMNWTPDATNTQINKIVATDSTLYVGGIFSAMAGQTRNCAAAFDAATANLLPWNPDVSNGGVTGSITDMVMNGTSLYVTGNFTDVGSRFVIGIAALDPIGGTARPGWPAVGVINSRALTISGDVVYVATNQGGGNPPAAGVVAIGLTSGTFLNSFQPDVEGSVNTLASTEGTVYAGGDFTRIRQRAGQGLAFFAK